MASDRARALPEPGEFMAMVEHLPVLCWMADPQGYIYYYNRKWYEYTGTRPAEMAGWGWQAVHDQGELPNVMERWRRALATRATVRNDLSPARGRWDFPPLFDTRRSSLVSKRRNCPLVRHQYRHYRVAGRRGESARQRPHPTERDR